MVRRVFESDTFKSCLYYSFSYLVLTLGLDEEKRVGRMVWQKYVDQQYLTPWQFELHGHFLSLLSMNCSAVKIQNGPRRCESKNWTME